MLAFFRAGPLLVRSFTLPSPPVILTEWTYAVDNSKNSPESKKASSLQAYLPFTKLAQALPKGSRPKVSLTIHGIHWLRLL